MLSVEEEWKGGVSNPDTWLYVFCIQSFSWKITMSITSLSGGHREQVLSTIYRHLPVTQHSSKLRHLSVPNQSIDKGHSTKELQDTINNLRKKLESAHNEINNINLENIRLQKEKLLINSLGITEAICNTPPSVKNTKKEEEKK